MPRRTKRRPGRPTILTHELANHILDIISDGNHATTAIAAVGISQSAFYDWIAKGRDAQDAIAAGESVDETQRVYAEFAERVARARARAEMRAVGTVRRSMEGGHVLSEEPVLDLEGQPVRDDSGEILYKRTYSAPDGKLALMYLERARPDEWARSAPDRVEVSGPNGAPVQVEQQVVIAGLAERVAAVAARRREDAELEAAEADDEGVYAITSGGED